jgi:hypothetical protein
LHRAVYQSGSYDYNLTGQLITDGITETRLPGWIVMSTSSQGVLPSDGREHVLDRHGSSQQPVQGPYGIGDWTPGYVVITLIDAKNQYFTIIAQKKDGLHINNIYSN